MHEMHYFYTTASKAEMFYSHYMYSYCSNFDQRSRIFHSMGDFRLLDGSKLTRYISIVNVVLILYTLPNTTDDTTLHPKSLPLEKGKLYNELICRTVKRRHVVDPVTYFITHPPSIPCLQSSFSP